MNQKGFAPIVVVLIVVGVLAIGGVAYYQIQKGGVIKPLYNPLPPQSSISQDQSRSVTEDPTIKDWKVYRNNGFGFEVKYPPDLLLSVTTVGIEKDSKQIESLNKDVINIPQEGEKSLVIRLESYDPFPQRNPQYKKLHDDELSLFENQRVGEIIISTSTAPEGGLTLVKETAVIEIDGKKAWRTVRQGASDVWAGYTAVFVVFNDGGDRLEMSTLLVLSTALIRGVSLEQAKATERNKVFDQILSTFRLLK